MSQPSDSSGSRLSNRRQQWLFTRKELRETLRDRRTIVTLLAMPLLVYPILGLAFRFMALSQLQPESVVWRIVVEKKADAEWIKWLLAAGDSLLEEQRELWPGSPSAVPIIRFSVPENPDDADLASAVSDRRAEIAVRFRRPKNQVDRLTLESGIEIVRCDRNRDSSAAAAYLQERVRALQMQEIESRGRRHDPDFSVPLQHTMTTVEPAESPNAILGFLPLVLMLMTVTGGVYPAIDLTAGERERDTLETLMALPVPRFRLMLAKFVAVVTVTLLTGFMNMAAMSGTVYALQLESTLFGAAGLTLWLLVRLILVLIVFALFYSSILLVVSSSARSFKEAQAYLIPLLLLSIAPGLVILIPGWQLNHGTAVLPMLNMLLMARDVFEGTAELLPSVAAVISTILYSTVLLFVAAHVFGTDSVTTGSRGKWNDLFSRPTRITSQPTLPSVLVVLTFLFPAHFLASGFLARASEASMMFRLLSSGVLTVLLFLAVPAGFAWWQRVQLRFGFRLQAGPAAAWPGALLLGVSAWPWVFEAVVVLQSWGLRGLDPSRLEHVNELLAGLRALPLPLTIATLGVIPGLCEELFFRGFLFSGIRRQFSGPATVGVSAIAFGVFHVILAGGAAPERLVPSTLMGLLLGWVALRTRSVFPSMVIHVLHNSLLLAIAHYREELMGWGIGIVPQQHMPASWLAAAAVGLGLGLSLMTISTHKIAKDLPNPENSDR